MRAIQKKIRSFALLLFLVCAVLSSVVIVAATSASGRISKLAETDQRYYAVTSAAELIADLLDEPVTIVKKEIITETSVETVKIDLETESMTNSNTIEQPAPDVKEYLLENKKADEVQDSDLATAVQFFGKDALGTELIHASLANDAACRIVNREPSFTRKLTLASDPLSSDLLGDSLTAEIEESVSNGRLVFTISNTGADRYQMRLIFNARTDTVPDSRRTVSEPSFTETYEGNTVTQVTRETTLTENTTKTTVTWELSSIQSGLTA